MAQTIKLKRSGTSGAIPTTSQLELGEVAINTYDGKMYIKKNVGGTESIVEVTVAAADAIVVEYQFTATANQTTFSGSDDNSETLSYSAGAVQIFLNGILLDSGVDYTATNGTSIVLSEVVDANDYLQVFAFKKKISNGQTTVDTFTGDDSTTAFTLSLDPGDENNTRVYIDGVYQSKGNYSVSGTTLTFSTAPPTGTAIEVEIGNRVVTLDTTSNLDLPDNVRLRLGTGQDMQLYHDGSNSYLLGTGGSGSLITRADLFSVQDSSNINMIQASSSTGQVSLYYNTGSTGAIKLRTTSTGVTVTGTAEAGGFTFDNYTLDSNKIATNQASGYNGDIFLDAAGDIILDADGGDVRLKDNGTEYLNFYAGTIERTGSLIFDVSGNITLNADGSTISLNDDTINFGQFYQNASGQLNIYAPTQDKDIVFLGNDGGSTVTALRLDMSAGGNATFNDLIKTGNMSISGQEIDVSSGSLTLDVADRIILDASTDGDVRLQDDGLFYGQLFQSSNNFYIRSRISDADIIFNGQDGSNFIDALTLDMSQAGRATFNEGIVLKSSKAGDFGVNINTASGDSMQLQVVDTGSAGAAHGSIEVSDGNLTLDVSGDIILDADGRDVYFADGGTNYFQVYNDVSNNVILNSVIQDKDIKFTGNDGGSTVTALTLDMSEAGAATFNSKVSINDDTNAKLEIGRYSSSIAHSHIKIGTNSNSLRVTNAADNADLFTITNNGYVGVGSGNTSPRYDLAVQGNNATAVGLAVDNQSGSGTLDLVALGATYNSHQAGGGEVWLYSPDNINIGGATGNTNDIKFLSNNAVRMKIQGSDGNVGIGATSPYKKLEVAGDIQLDATDANIWLKSGAAGTNGFINWTFNSDSTVYNKIGMDYDTRATTGFHIDAGYPITIDATASSDKAISFAIGGVTKALFDGTGKLGVGTDNPTSNLHSNINSSSGAFLTDGNVYALELTNSNTTNGAAVAMTFGHGGYDFTNFIASVRTGTGANPKGDLAFGGRPSDGATFKETLRITASERVGIGTALPGGKLDVQENTTGALLSRVWNTNTSGTGESIFRIANGGNNAQGSRIEFTDQSYFHSSISGDRTNGLQFGTNATGSTGIATERMRIKPDGKVGIGNNDPLQKLSVNGLINSDTNEDYYGAWINGDTASNGYSIVAVGEWYSDALYIQKKTGEARTHIYNYNANRPLIINAGSSAHGETTTAKSRLGIGTFSPNAVVHIQGQNPAGLIVENGTNNAPTQPFVSMAANNYSSGYGTFRWEDQRASQSSPSFIWEVRDGSGTVLAYDFRTGSTGVAGSKLAITQSGDVGIGTNSPSQKLEVSGTALVENAKFKAIDTSNSDTAKDVFIYDTRKDSDGGAWRKRTQHTSWYNETLNTSIRGSRKEFPCVAVLVYEEDQLTIYDGDDPDLPMWLVINAGGGDPLYAGGTSNACAALNGEIIAGNGDTAVSGSLGHFNFIKDFAYLRINSTSAYNATTIVNRNSAWSSDTVTGVTEALVDRDINDVAMTVLPNAPIDSETGLPVPTIAVATNGGVSVIKDDGKVVDIIGSSSVYNYWDAVKFTEDNKLIIQANYQQTANQLTHVVDFPTEDTSANQVNSAYTTLNGRYYHGDSCTPRLSVSSFKPKVVPMQKDMIAMGHGVELNGGLNLIAEEPSTVSGITSDAALCFIEHNFNTGWMVGDTRLAALSDNDTTTISSSGNTNLLSGQWTNNSSFPYETFTSSGLDITSAINTTAYGAANKTWTAEAGKTYTAYFNLTLNSGTAPTLYVQTSSSFGNNLSYQTVNGANSFTFRATMSTSSYFSFSVGNGVATNFSVSNLELYEGGVTNHVQDPLQANISEYPSLSVIGTITKTVVATGAELVGYKPNSSPSSNYLCINETDWSIGTGDFSISFWWYGTSTGDTSQIYLGTPGSAASPSNGFNIWTYGGLQKMYISGTYLQHNDGGTGRWLHKTFVRRSGVLYAYENGHLEVSGDAAGSINDQKFSVFYGYYGATNPAGSMALLRVSKTPATEEQIKRSYNDEKHLFEPNAGATLAGTSSYVTGLAYDKDTELLHVGSSWGRSVFQGLRRIEYNSDAVGTVIDASSGFVVEE